MDMQAHLTVNISRHGKSFVAYSPTLDISTSGKSEAEVKRRFVDVVHLFVEELEEMGTTKEVLTELGWKPQARAVGSSVLAGWKPPAIKSTQISIPVAA